MLTVSKLMERMKEVFEEAQARVLAEVIFTSYNDLVKTSDFNELKGIVKELAEAQKESQKEMSKLDKSMQELAESQKMTDIKMGELAEAQKGSQKEIGKLDKSMQELTEAQKMTDIKMGELAEAQKETQEEIKTLVKESKTTRGDLGGLSKSMGYAIENEAFRVLPKVLKEKYGIDVYDRLVRADVGGKEINIYGKGKKNGKDIFIVGETKLRLDERRLKKEGEDVFEQLEEKVEVAKEEAGDVEIFRLLITHFATKGFLSKAKDNGVIVVQSFEWE